jgi:hypothetical protein
MTIAATQLGVTGSAGKFSGKYSHRTITGGVGHNLPQEAPQAFDQAEIDVDGLAKVSHAP